MEYTSEPAVSIASASESNAREWGQYVLKSPAAVLGHAWQWRAAINRAYGHETLYLVARESDRLCGILPLILVHRPLLGTSFASMPFLDCAGVCADNATIAQRLIETARDFSGRAKGTIELRQGSEVSGLREPRRDKVTMVLDLMGGSEGLWKRLPAKVRNQVRKAEKSGLSTVVGGAELLKEFYSVFVVNMRDLGSPVHDVKFFTAIAEEFGPHFRVRLVRDGTKAIGGLVSLVFKDTVVVPWASALREYFPKCPNNLLYWQEIENRCAEGYKLFDFGRSSRGSGTYEFKRQWGAEPVQLHWYAISDHAGHGHAIEGTGLAARCFQRIWQQLPVRLTAVLGPRIRKYLTN